MRQKWNMYVLFGIQQFVSPHDYVAFRAQETIVERHFCLARFRVPPWSSSSCWLIPPPHLRSCQNRFGNIPPGILQHVNPRHGQIHGILARIDTEMQNSHSTTTQEAVATTTTDPNHTDSSKTQSTASSLAVAAAKRTDDNKSTSSSQASDSYQTQDEFFIAVPVTSRRSNTRSDTKSTANSTAKAVSAEEPTPNDDMEMDISPTVESPPRMEKHTTGETATDPTDANTPEEFFGVPSLHPNPPCDITESINDNPSSCKGAQTPKRSKSGKKQKGKKASATIPAADHVSTNNHPPISVDQTVHIEVRWAPKDFHELRSSSEKMFSRLAPILSCFNTKYTWIVEWQTDQIEDLVKIDPKQLVTKYLSIRIVPVVKERAFYFSFRIFATGSQFTQVVKSDIMEMAKLGERMSLDPTLIPPQQGELIFVGNILLKDAMNTHRGHYLRYLQKKYSPKIPQPSISKFPIKIRFRVQKNVSVKPAILRSWWQLTTLSTWVSNLLSVLGGDSSHLCCSHSITFLWQLVMLYTWVRLCFAAPVKWFDALLTGNC